MKDLISRLPTFLASPLQKLKESDDTAGQGGAALKLVELLGQYLALVGLAEASAMGTMERGLSPSLIFKLQKPTSGVWLELLREVLKAHSGAFTQFAVALDSTAAAPQFTKLWKTLEPAWGGRDPTVSQRLAMLLQIRNQEGHTWKWKVDFEHVVPNLVSAVLEVLEALEGLWSWRIVGCKKFEVQKPLWQHTYVEFRGPHPEQERHGVPPFTALEPGSVYLWDGALEFRCIWPFLAFREKRVSCVASFDTSGVPEYLIKDPDLGQEALDSAVAELRSKLPCLFERSVAKPAEPVSHSAPSRTAPLELLVQRYASDGVITLSEWRGLLTFIESLGLAPTPEAARDLALEAIRVHGSDAKLSPEILGSAVAVTQPVTPGEIGAARSSPEREEENERDVLPVWALGALARVADDLGSLVKKVDGTVELSEDDDDQLCLRFRHAVWKPQGGNRALLLSLAMEGGATTLSVSLSPFEWGAICSPLDRILRASAPLPVNSDSLLMQSPGGDGFHFHREFAGPDDLAGFMMTGPRCGRDALRSMADAVEQAWDGLPRWAQLASSERVEDFATSTLKKAADDEAGLDPWFLWTLGRALFHEEKHPEAERIFDSFDALAPQHPLGPLGKAWIAYAERRYPDALRHYQAYRLRDEGVESDDDLAAMAKSAEWTCDGALALELWTELRDRNPEFPEVRCWIGAALSTLDRDDEALVVFQAEIDAGRDVPRAAERIAVIHRNRGHYDAAVAALQAAARDGKLLARHRKAMERIEAWRRKGTRSGRYGGASADGAGEAEP